MSPPFGFSGLVGFTRSVRRNPWGFALRFLLGFAGVSLLWLVLAPAYAAGMAAAANMFAPLLEADSGSRYDSLAGKVVAFRSVEVDGQMVFGRQGLWSSNITWNTSLLVAAILATPGWAWPRRGRALGVGVGVLAASHFLNLLVNIAYTQVYPTLGAPTSVGWGAVLLEWLSRLFDMMAAGFLPIVIFAVLLAGPLGPLPDARELARARPNEPCPCGSGAKFKNCCRS